MRLKLLDTMIRRIVGIESELGVHSPVGHYLTKLMPNSHLYPSGHLPNGARFYMDIGAHPEYATPECMSFMDLLAADAAGLVFVSKRHEQALGAVAHESLLPETRLLRNNKDSEGISFGGHESYLVERIDATSFPRLEQSLLPHLVSRIALIGAGLLDRGRFAISARADVMLQIRSSETTRNRAIINERDEPHADHRRFKRLHLICGDSNMSQISTLLKVGTTSLVLTLVEEGLIPAKLALVSPLVALRTISSDLSLTAAVELASGEHMTALEIQREYLNLVKRYKLHNLNDEFGLVCSLWEEMLDRLSLGPAEARKHLDWCAKYSLISSFADKKSLSLAHPELKALDILYHEIGPAGLQPRLHETGRLKRLVSDEVIARFVDNPPKTRAQIRGAFITTAIRKLYGGPQVVFSASWDKLTWKNKSVSLPDPFKTVSYEADRLFMD